MRHNSYILLTTYGNDTGNQYRSSDSVSSQSNVCTVSRRRIIMSIIREVLRAPPPSSADCCRCNRPGAPIDTDRDIAGVQCALERVYTARTDDASTMT